MAKPSPAPKKHPAAPKSAPSHAGHGQAKSGGKETAKNGAKPAAKPAAKSAAKPEKSVPAAKSKAKPEKPSALAAAKPPAPAPAPEKEKKSRGDLSPKILHLIAEEMAIEEAELTPAASFKEDLGLDEIDVAELLMQAEQAFGVHTFNEEDWESCETVGDFIELVEKRVAAKRGKKPAAHEAKGKNAKA